MAMGQQNLKNAQGSHAWEHQTFAATNEQRS